MSCPVTSTHASQKHGTLSHPYPPSHKTGARHKQRHYWIASWEIKECFGSLRDLKSEYLLLLLWIVFLKICPLWVTKLYGRAILFHWSARYINLRIKIREINDHNIQKVNSPDHCCNILGCSVSENKMWASFCSRQHPDIKEELISMTTWRKPELTVLSLLISATDRELLPSSRQSAAVSTGDQARLAATMCELSSGHFTALWAETRPPPRAVKARCCCRRTDSDTHTHTGMIMNTGRHSKTHKHTCQHHL